MDMVNGGGRLGAWAEHMILLEKGNNLFPLNRIMKMVKCRHSEEVTGHFLLSWDNEKLQLTNEGIVDNPRTYTIPSSRAQSYKDVLDQYEFDKDIEGTQIRNHFEVNMGISVRMGKSYLKQLVSDGYLVKIRRNIYRKRFERLKDDTKEKADG